MWVTNIPWNNNDKWTPPFFLHIFLKNLHLRETLILSASQNEPCYLDMVMKPKNAHKHFRVSYMILQTCILCLQHKIVLNIYMHLLVSGKLNTWSWII
jgi:hypothetical protein